MKDEIIFTPFYLSFLRLCQKKGLSPTAVAKKVGIASGAPTAWKNNGAIPRPEQLKKLCVFFDVSENELLGYSEQKEKPPAHSGEPPKYNHLTPENRAIIDDLIEKLFKRILFTTLSFKPYHVVVPTT